MPLSEEELRLLEQMERALVEDDPKLASTLRGTSIRRTARRRALLGAVGFVIGVGVLMTGAITNQVVIGIVGFGVMLASATLALTALRGQQQVAASDEDPRGASTDGGFAVIEGGRSGKSRKSKGRAGKSARPSRSSGSFMERMEQRWRRRRDTNGY